MKKVEKIKRNDKDNIVHVKLKWMIISAVTLVFIGVIMILIGMFIPPIGEIHPSVLTALGELFTFSGSLWGLNTHYRIKTNQIEADMNMKNISDDSNE